MKRIEGTRPSSRRNMILKTLPLLMLASIGTGASLSAPVGGRYPSYVQLSGIVTDTDCGATHGTKTHGDAQCTRLCVKMGADYALAVGKYVYVLRGHEVQLNEFAGDRVMIRGTKDRGNTIEVESVVPVVVEATKRARE